MIKIIENKVAIIPVYDSDMRGSLHVPFSAKNKRKVPYFSVEDHLGKIYLETEDYELALNMRREQMKIDNLTVIRKKKREEEDFYDTGERCDQGVVKYIGKDVKDIKRGDYVIFSGYTGQLIRIEGEGKFIITREPFVECKYMIDEFITVPGLYIKSKVGDGKYVFNPVTYEQAMNLCAEAFTLHNKTLDIKSGKPSLEDYNR